MKKTPVRLVALDLDGTVLNSQHQITQVTKDAIAYTIAQGVKVVIATGKSRFAALGLIKELNIATHGIFYQGQVIYEGNGDVFYEQTVSPHVVRGVVDLLKNDYALVGYSTGGVFCATRNPLNHRITDGGDPLPLVRGSWENILATRSINKLVVVGDSASIRSLRPQLTAHLGPSATLIQTDSDMLEILSRGASKGLALKILLKHYRILPEEVIAIGDGENDVEMLQLAGMGVAMGNAVPLAVAAADHITDTNNNDGVAKALMRFV
jgi:Cof subfamily protein (haloacid dehalogenase superfamily)